MQPARTNSDDLPRLGASAASLRLDGIGSASSTSASTSSRGVGSVASPHLSQSTTHAATATAPGDRPMHVVCLSLSKHTETGRIAALAAALVTLVPGGHRAPPASPDLFYALVDPAHSGAAADAVSCHWRVERRESKVLAHAQREQREQHEQRQRRASSAVAGGASEPGAPLLRKPSRIWDRVRVSLRRRSRSIDAREPRGLRSPSPPPSPSSRSPRDDDDASCTRRAPPLRQTALLSEAYATHPHAAVDACRRLARARGPRPLLDVVTHLTGWLWQQMALVSTSDDAVAWPVQVVVGGRALQAVDWLARDALSAPGDVRPAVAGALRRLNLRVANVSSVLGDLCDDVPAGWGRLADVEALLGDALRAAHGFAPAPGADAAGDAARAEPAVEPRCFNDAFGGERSALSAVVALQRALHAFGDGRPGRVVDAVARRSTEFNAHLGRMERVAARAGRRDASPLHRRALSNSSGAAPPADFDDRRHPQRQHHRTLLAQFGLDEARLERAFCGGGDAVAGGRSSPRLATLADCCRFVDRRSISVFVLDRLLQSDLTRDERGRLIECVFAERLERTCSRGAAQLQSLANC